MGIVEKAYGKNYWFVIINVYKAGSLIRKGLHALGFRYRLHSPKLPGKPDIVLPRYRAIILINGCFWHAHNCHLFKWPLREKSSGKQKYFQTPDAIMKISSIIGIRAGRH
jgi:DNA mismatch endonuclease Vsr